jgi:hypothetical protein
MPNCMRRLKVVANRSPALLKARFSTEVEVPFLNVADAEAELVIGTLKIEMLPPVSPNATLPAESTPYRGDIPGCGHNIAHNFTGALLCVAQGPTAAQ